MQNSHIESSPSQEEMNEGKLAKAFRLLDQGVTEKKMPGATTVICRNGKIVATYATGKLIENGSNVFYDSIYDCASLTKVVVTLPLALKLLEDGHLDANARVSTFIPAFSNGQKSNVTIQQLLTHTSGLKPFVRGAFKGWSPEAIKSHIYQQDLENAPGTRVLYSDLGFIILAEVISRVFQLPLDKAAQKHIFLPLGMTDSCFNPQKELMDRIAATEFREELGDYQRGEVHDERAHALGGVSGHAGLFSTAIDLAYYVKMWLKNGKIGTNSLFSPVTIKAAIRNLTSGLEGNRGLGWVLKGDPFDASGIFLSPHSYGHTGFTGTSIWMDPVNRLGVVLLTNRVHYGRDVSILGLRRRFHNAVAGCIE